MPTSRQMTGDRGEKDVIKRVRCPNCGKSLKQLPTNFPLCDVQCSGCQFRAQVRTLGSKPVKEIRGSGWVIMEKVLKAGYLSPPLIVNFKWKEKGKKRQEIYFYPFIPKENLKKRQLPPTARRANYKMFNYVRLDEIPYFPLFRK